MVAWDNGGGGTIAYRDSGGFWVGQVAAQTIGCLLYATAARPVLRSFPTRRSSDLILLQGGAGTLTLAQNVNAGAGDVRLSSGANINQSGGAITAPHLGAHAATGISLTTATNDV